MVTSSLPPSLLSPFPTLTQRPPNQRFFFKRKPLPLVVASCLGDPPPRTKTETKPDSTSSGSGSWVSPDWLTALARSLAPRDDSGIPVANGKLEDVSDLLGGALFLPLFKWMLEYGPVYRLAAGPRNFVVVSDPAVAKHVLRSYGTKYGKGLVSEVSQFLFGSGFATAEGSLWTVYAALSLPPSL